MSGSFRSYGLKPTRILSSWDSPGKNTGVGSHSLLQGIFLIQVSKLCLLYRLHWQTDSLPLSHPGSPLDRLEQWAKYIDRYRYGYGWTSLVAQLVKHLPAMQETLVQFLGQEYIIYNPWRRDILPTPVFLGFPGGSVSKEPTCNTGNLGSAPGLGRSPWRRAWQPTPVFLPTESPWTEEPGGLQSMGSHRVRHD